MINVCLPGTGGMMPLPERFLTCCYLEYQGKAILIDCGEGTQVALRKSGCKLSRMELLLITHLHADHVAGLPGLLLTTANSGKRSPLLIAGPDGTKQTLEALMMIAPSLPFEVQVIEIDTARLAREEPSALRSGWDGLEVFCLPLHHSIPCLGYQITVHRKPVFDPEKAEALGVPVQDFRTLHGGKSVVLEDGREVFPEQVIAGQRDSLRVCYMTDSRPSQGMRKLAEGADLLIAEGMYGDEAMVEKAEEKTHMLFSESARLAKDAAVKRLWLTHYSPSMSNPQEYEAAAQRIFPETKAALDGMKITL